MPTLLETQRAVCRALVSGDVNGAVECIAPGGTSLHDALAIYRGTFVSAATKALRLTYPAIERLTDTGFFESAAEEFIFRNPPNSGCLDDYGEAFADFLAAFPAAASLPYLADVAKLEWAINKAFRAPDVDAPDHERLSAAANTDPARLILKLHPSLSLVTLNYPADTIWRAVLQEDDAALGAITLQRGSYFLLIARDEEGVQVERSTESAMRFLSLVAAGRSFAEAFEAAPAEETSALVAEFFSRGRCIGFEEIR